MVKRKSLLMLDLFLRRGTTIHQKRLARISLATGVSESTVKRVSKEYRVEGEFKSPEKKYLKDRVRLNPDDFNRNAIRRIMYDSYLNKDYPTLDSVLRKARSTGVFDSGRTTLSKLLKSMGFRYKKREDGKKYIYKQPRVIEQHHQYLRRMRHNREERRPEVFLDERWTSCSLEAVEVGDVQVVKERD